MDGYLSITQLAHLRNVTTETLRHYDRIGLLKPAYVDPETAYRYYSMDQIEVFDTVIDLKNMGLPLKSIQEFMPVRNVARSYEILSQKVQELEQEIQEKSRMLRQLRQKTAYIEMIKKDRFREEDLSHTKLGGQKMVISRTEVKNYHEFIYEFTKLRVNLKQEDTIFGSNLSGSLIDPDSFLDPQAERLIRHPALPYEVCKEEITYGELITLPKADYLVTYGTGVFVTGDAGIERIRDYLRENHYRVAGYLCERDIIDISLTNDPCEVIYRLEIPIEKTESEKSSL